MPREPDIVDPYSPPPPRKDKSGRFVRYALVAAMLGAGAYGFMQFSQTSDQTATLTPPANEQLADASYRVTPEAIPQATPAPEASPPSQTRRAAPAPAEPAPVAPPSTQEVTPEPATPMAPSTAG